MRLSILASAATILAQEDQLLDTWTVFNSSISCGAEACQYNLPIYKHGSREIVQCRLNMKGTPNMRTFFADQTCQPDPSHALTVSWASDHSIIFCIVDMHKRVGASYAFDEWEISDGQIAPNKTKTAWRDETVLPLSTTLIDATVMN
ncbi:hypothetical protein F5Y11DRAFT_335572 [Daldinia sp. FL1419]|nr:hypothetical protein F5Y11DRAFT_335572 [Daldinia sp. FL1419]